MHAFDPSNLVAIPLQHQHQLFALRSSGSCWVFARQTYTPSIWMVLKREGFDGDLVSTSAELSDFQNELGASSTNRVLNFYHGTEGVRRSRWRVRDEFESLVLSQQLQVYRLDIKNEHRLADINDRLFASESTRHFIPGDVISQQRFNLAQELGNDIQSRWQTKVVADSTHFQLSTFRREITELKQAGQVVGDAAWGALTGVWDGIVFVVEFAADAVGSTFTALKGLAEFQLKMQSAVLDALQGNNKELLTQLEAMGVKVHNAATNTALAAQKIAKAVVNKLKQGKRFLDLLMNDHRTRELVRDYLDSLWQSTKYTDSRLMGLKAVSTLVFEIGIDVLIGLATCGAGMAVKRAGQIAGKASKAASLRFGPFTAKAMDLLSDLARRMDNNLANDGPRSQSLLEVPEEARVTSSNKKTATATGSPKADAVPEKSNQTTTNNDSGKNKNNQGCKKDDGTPCGGEPISLVTGEEILGLTDFTLNGVTSFQWLRKYKTSNPDNLGMGVGWTHPFSEKLVVNDLGIAWHTSEARIVPLGSVAVGSSTTNRREQITLIRNSHERYTLVSNEGALVKCFDLKNGNTYLPTSVRDGVGNGVDLVYDRALKLKSIQSDYGAQWELHYQKQLINKVTWQGAAGETKTLAQYFYDDSCNLIQAKDANGNSEYYQYSNHIITRRTLKSGYRFHFKWTELTTKARCLRNWGDKINGQPTYDYRFNWDIPNKSVEVTDTRGGTEAYRFNASGSTLYKRDQEGAETHYEYDQYEQVTKITDAGGRTQHFAYDTQQRLIQVTGIDGTTTQFKRDGQGNIVETIDAQGQAWRRSYASNGLIKSQTNPLNETFHYDYNALGLPRTITNPMGQSWHYIWDNLGQLTAVRNPKGQHTRYKRNGEGLAEAIVHPDGTRIKYQYNGNGQCTKIQTADGKTQQFEYTELGLLAKQTDPAGRTTHYQYNGLSQVVKRVDSLGHSLQYHYDGERNLVGLTNQNGEQYHLKYDLNERLIEEAGFDGRTQRYEYNALGYLTASEEINPATRQCLERTRYQRNAYGQLTEQWHELQNGQPIEQQLKQFQYDETGRLTAANNPSRQLKWAYDALGRVTEVHQDNAVIHHRYDALGRRIGSQLPDGNSIDYQYDELGLLASIGLNNQQLTHIIRDELGRETERAHSNNLHSQSSYDPQGRLQSHSLIKSASLTTLNARQYGYNESGQLSQITDTRRGTTHYQYDAIDRLVAVQGPQPETFVHDPAGNLLGNSEEEPKPQQVTNNRLNFFGDSHYEYDPRGNRVKEKRGKDGKLVTHYQYDGLNQLVGVITPKASTVYEYDALGRRIKKSTQVKGQKQVTEFLWNDDVLLSEQQSGAETNAKTYLFEPNSFKPLAYIQNNQTYHYHLDHLGTPQEISNAQGELVWAAQYKAYGNLAVAEINEVENNLRFQGQYFDEETGLHYNRFRYYDPEVGRFTQQDPIGLLGGANNYQYVPNPVGWVDPLGLSSKEPPEVCPKKSIPDDYDLAEDMHVNSVVESNAGRYFIEDSNEIYSSISGLPPDLYQHEFLALRTYTGPYYEEMNGVLRGKTPELGTAWQPVNNSAARALDKLAGNSTRKFRGTTYRGTPMTEDKVHERFPDVGEIYTDKGFSSSTTDPNKAFAGNVQMKIESKSGVMIDDISAIPSEDEVLFKPDTKFRITKKEQSSDGTWHIDLLEED